MCFKFKKIFVFLVIFTLTETHPLFSQQIFDNWVITPGSDGKTATIVYSDPITYLKIEKDLEMSVDGNGTATGGTIHFRNGFKRAMTLGEVTYYFNEFGALNAYWDFREKQGSIDKYNLDSDTTLPLACVGKQVRAIFKTGTKYIGTYSIIPPPSTGDWFSLNIQNSVMTCYRKAVKEIQVLR
jgi:hypothetical protein